MAVAADEVGGKLVDMESSENSDLSQELQVLKEIYITELSISRDASGQLTSIDVQLHPATGENVSQKWVCLTLQLIPPPDYPHSIPEICIRGPRGLADEHVASMKKSLYQIAEDRKGEPMMYELIESAKESLTQLNIPYGQCMICLDDFSGCHQEFTKTDCYHYFHCGCLSMYVNHCKAELEALEPRNAFADKEVVKQIVCPVCRELLPSDIDLSAFQADSGAEMSEERFIPSEEMRRLQRTMADLFEKQRQRGGIIDLDEERNKYLLPKDFVYVGPVEESSQDAALSESVQAVSALKENEKTSKSPQQQRQREYGGREGNKGMREHERGGRGARRNRKEYDFERSEVGREREEYGNERGEYGGNERGEYGNQRRGVYGNERRGEYGRKRGDHGRDGEYAKERNSTYARDRGGYRRPKQEEKEGRWRNEEGSRSNRSNKFYDQKRGVGISSTADEAAQNKSVGNEKVSIENGNIEKVSIEKVEQAVETEQRIETENSGLGSTVTPDIQFEGGSAKLDQLQKVDDVKSQSTTKNSRQNDDGGFRGREAPFKKSGNFPRRERRQEHDHYYDQRVEEKFPRRNVQKSQHRAERRPDFRAKGSDNRDHRSERSAEIPNSSEQSVKESETSQKEEMENDKKLEKDAATEVNISFQGQSEPIRSGNQSSSSKESSAQKLENDAGTEITRSCQEKSEPIRSGNQSNSKTSSARDNHYRGQRNRRQDQDQNQYHDDRSKSNLAKKEEILKDKTAGERRDSLKDRGSEMANRHPEQPKDLADGETKTLGQNTNNDDGIPHISKASVQRQSSKPENHFKPRLHARGNAVKACDVDERRVDTVETSREHLRNKDIYSKPKTTTDRKAREYPDKAAVIQRNLRNPQRSEAKSHPKEGRQFNDRQKFRKDAKLETARDRSDISESRPAQNDRPIYDEPSSSLDAANSKSDRSSEIHPGFHIRSIARVETELCKTLDL